MAAMQARPASGHLYTGRDEVHRFDRQECAAPWRAGATLDHAARRIGSRPMKPAARIAPLGDCALQITLGARLGDAINAKVHALARRIHAAALPGLRDLVPAYTTLTLHYDPLTWTHDALSAALTALLTAGDDAADAAGSAREVCIPVCYGGEHGPDLMAVAAHAGLSSDAVIQRHTGVLYRVYFLGFTPGFAYLGGLDPRLAMARKATPRPRVSAGSVGIASLQTGVYPQATPGGWQIIGRTPLTLFDPARSPPCLLAPDDRVRFVAIEGGAFDRHAGTP